MKSFAELNLPESVASALRDRNYENAMPVQAAVMEDRSTGRDLLVSSQTGSGKTIAFGLALAKTLLGEGETKFARRPHPAALVIVPTRELATQVREELGWLLQHTAMRLASFTGGTAVTGDLTALKRGVDLAIGTPGRLVDLVQRGRLELGQLSVVVLDEADEMLDLGFRDDLETLLKAAPADRRTLMLSATMPSGIRELARQYQRDALPVDPRTEAGAPRSAPHEDIAFVAHLIAGPDRRAAVLNVLRASNAERAIVFCTTREGVGELHRYLVGHGFTATAISGDRAQAERDRALDQVRRGEARVLVATNVAARGIHLPDVDLIIHADLPLNAESLTHRSGRTGRAGRKGTAVLLATGMDRRKAERLLSMAHVKAVWTAPPSAKQIAEASAARLIETLTGDETTVSGERAARADELLAGLRAKLQEAQLDDSELLRRLLARELERLPAGEVLRSVAIPAAGSGFAPSADRGPRSRSEFSSGSVLFRVNMGAQDKAEARWLLPLICRRGGITNRDVGAIRVGPRETTFEIAGPAAADFAAAAAETDPRAPHVRIERADGQGRGAYPSRPAPRPYRATEPRRPSTVAAMPPSPPPEPVAASAPAEPAEKQRAPSAPAAATEREASPPPAATKIEHAPDHAPSAPAAAPKIDRAPSRPPAPRSDRAPSRPPAPRSDRPMRAGDDQRRPGGAAPRPSRDDRPSRGPARADGPSARPPRSYGTPPVPPRRAFGQQPRREETAHRPAPHAARPTTAKVERTSAPASAAKHAPKPTPPVAREERPRREERPAATPFHRPGFSTAPAARVTDGHTPAFRARGARPAEASAQAPVQIERKIHPPSHLRAQPHPRAKPRAK